MKCLVRRKKRNVNEFRGGKLRRDVGIYFTVDTFVQNTSLSASCEGFFFPPRRVPTAQSVMRHESRQQMCKEEMEPQWCQEPEKWADVLRVFYLTVSGIEPRHRLRCVFLGGVTGVRIRTTQNKTTQHVNHRQSASCQLRRCVLERKKINT